MVWNTLKQKILNAGILLIWTLGTNFSENLSKIYTFSFKKMHLKMSSAKWREFCLGLNVLKFFLMKDKDRYTLSGISQGMRCNDASHWLGSYLDWSLLI